MGQLVEGVDDFGGMPGDGIRERLASTLADPEQLEALRAQLDAEKAQFVEHAEPTVASQGHTWTDAERLEAVEYALADSSFVDVAMAVEVSDGFSDSASDVMIAFDDSAAHVVSDLIDEFVDALPTLVRGCAAVREDRDVVIVSDGERGQVERSTRRWWSRRLRGELAKLRAQ